MQTPSAQSVSMAGLGLEAKQPSAAAIGKSRRQAAAKWPPLGLFDASLRSMPSFRNPAAQSKVRLNARDIFER